MNDGNEPGQSNARQLIAALLVLAVLIVVGLWLAGTFRSNAAIQDCVASGRTNCAPIR